MKNIGVFCSASSNIDAIYQDCAADFGQWLGKNDKTLVYGGVERGLMEIIARNTNQNGGKVIGIVPELLQERASSYLSSKIISKDLSDRKDYILEHSDQIVAFPGGIGTLDEVFHVMCSRYMKYHDKKIIFYNINGFYSSLLTCLAEYKRKGFVNSNLSDLYEVANTDAELKALLK